MILPKLYYLSLFHQTSKKKTSFFDSMDERTKSFLEKHNLDSSKFLGMNPPYRFQEFKIEIGEKVSVLGHGKWEETSDQNHQRGFPKSLVFKHNNQHTLYVSDKPETF